MSTWLPRKVSNLINLKKKKKKISHPAITLSKLTIETVEQDVTYVQS